MKSRKGLQLFKLLCASVLIGLAIVFGYSICLSNLYPQSVGGCLKPATKGLIKTCISGAVSIYDPCEVIKAETGPDSEPPTEYQYVDDSLLNLNLAEEKNGNLKLVDFQNAKIKRSPLNFSYQPYNEPRLKELREKYKLDEVVADADSEFEKLVLLRNWARSQFHRENYQPFEYNFDALRVLDRNLKVSGIQYDQEKHFDPCHFFPLFYSQIALSMGYTSRLIAAEHGMAEVWSNDFQKWVLMDAELNYHVIRDGIPLNLLEIAFASADEIEIVRGEQSSDENPFQVHLKIDVISPQGLIDMIRFNLNDIVDLRNDWMTNHYFRGHPARGDQNSLTFISRFNEHNQSADRHLRPVTTDREKFYWTLNQSEVYFQYLNENRIKLFLRTHTPNFDHFEISLNGKITDVQTNETELDLESGENEIEVKTINQFGREGIVSRLNFLYSPTN